MGHIDPELLKRLDLLAAKLNVGAQYLWSVFTRQAVFDGYYDLFLALVMFIPVVVYWSSWYYFSKNKREDLWTQRNNLDTDGRYYSSRYTDVKVQEARYDWFKNSDRDAWGVFLAFGVVLHIVAITMFIGWIGPAIAHIYNPGYYAFSDLMRSL